MPHILIFGDICPVKDTIKSFKSGEINNLISPDILEKISKADITVGNLECALTESPQPILKTGPVLHAPTSCADTLKSAGFSALSLANNHIRDCGNEGVISTVEACKKAGISTFGAGETVADAKRPYIAEVDGKKVAFISFAEEEFNAAGRKQAGAAIIDVYEDFDHIRKIKKTVDYLIILYHGGIEYHPYPSPLLQKRCRKMVDCGADLVLCQHSHCVGTYERYNDSTILYGQGNNLFGYRKGNDSWNEGLLAEVIISDNKLGIDFIPCHTDGRSIFSLLPKQKGQKLIEEVTKRSEEIKSQEFIEERWHEFCAKLKNLNLPLLLGWNRYLIFLNRKLGGLPLRLIYGSRKRMISNNLIRCESHQEVLRELYKE